MISLGVVTGMGLGKRINYEEVLRDRTGKDPRGTSQATAASRHPFCCLVQLSLTLHAAKTTAKSIQNGRNTGTAPSKFLPPNDGLPITLRHLDYQLGGELTQAEWVAAAEKISGGCNKVKKEDMEEWVSPSDSVRRRWGYGTRI